MADYTRKAMVMKELEDRVSTRLEARMAELAGSIQSTLHASLKDTIDT